MRTAFDFAKQEVLTAIRKEETQEYADYLIERSEPLLNEVSAGLLNAIATGTETEYLTTLPQGDSIELSYCQYCLQQAAGIIEKIHTTE